MAKNCYRISFTSDTNGGSYRGLSFNETAEEAVAEVEDVYREVAPTAVVATLMGYDEAFSYAQKLIKQETARIEKAIKTLDSVKEDFLNYLIDNSPYLTNEEGDEEDDWVD
jgi:hypothetical protein